MTEPARGPTTPPVEPPAPEEPVQGGIAIIFRNGQVLVRQRPQGSVYQGYWEFPGGKLEPGETPEQAVVRECIEEIGLRVRVLRPRARVRHRYPHGLVELHFHDCVLENPDQDPDPLTGFIWKHPRELPSLQFPEANELIVRAIATAGQDPQSAPPIKECDRD
jgi:8-oxo-dGTP diphosphatase